jgi:hypothetical protein
VAVRASLTSIPTITGSGPSPVSHLIACGCGAHAEVDEDGEDPPIGVLTIGNVELEQQPPNMGFDGPFAEDQPFGDTSVRHPLRHQPEHFVLTLGELGEAVLAGLAVEQRGDHLRVERRASVGDSCDGIEEVRNLQHPVLQQITKSTETGKLHAVRRLDVLREQEDTQVGPRRFERGSGTGALVGE